MKMKVRFFRFDTFFPPYLTPHDDGVACVACVHAIVRRQMRHADGWQEASKVDRSCTKDAWHETITATMRKSENLKLDHE